MHTVQGRWWGLLLESNACSYAVWAFRQRGKSGGEYWPDELVEVLVDSEHPACVGVGVRHQVYCHRWWDRRGPYAEGRQQQDGGGHTESIDRDGDGWRL